MTSDVKQEIKQKHLPYLTLFYAATKKRPSNQNRVCFTLVQELGTHLQWSKDGYSILKQCHEHYMSTYLWFTSYVQTDLAKIKVSTRS